MEYEKHVEGKQAVGIILGLMIIGLSLILSIQRNPNTGLITINPMVMILGILTAVLIYFFLTFPGIRARYPPRMRFCVTCGRNIPFDAVICPYCRHDYELSVSSEF